MGNNPKAIPEPYLPDFQVVANLLLLVLTTELLVMALTLTASSSLESFWTNLGLKSLYAQWLALASAMALTLARTRWISHFGATGQSLMALGSVAVLNLPLSLIADHYYPSASGFWPFFLNNLAVSLLLSGLLLRYLYIQHQYRLRQSSEARFRFQALQARIRPHFLFNSMNTIASLTRLNPAMAEQVVEDLADLFRASLADIDKLVTLEQEFELARQYLNIERQRLGDRIQVEWNIEQILPSAMLPRLTLQPLLENAVYHGIEQSPQGGLIRITGHQESNLLRLTICNPVSPQSHKASSREQLGIAVDNVKQRLSALYGDCSQLSTEQRGDLYCVSLLIPISEHEYSARR